MRKYALIDRRIVARMRSRTSRHCGESGQYLSICLLFISALQLMGSARKRFSWILLAARTKLDEVNSVEAAQLLRGKTMELYREDLPEELIFASELYGVEVYADAEKIGMIEDVLDYPGNSVYVVRGEHEYMIPAVKQFILSTDLESNTMQVQLLEGMRSDED